MKRKQNTSPELLTKLSKYKRYCKCGHSIIITPTAKYNRTMCTWCGSWIYKNDLEEFKDNIKKVLK